jgi:hypothetical protein
MKNQIIRAFVASNCHDPVKAEVEVTLYTDRLTDQTEVRGQLEGPRCRYSSTIEVAYALRETERELLDDVGQIKLRAIIPDPSQWEPQCPFLYRGFVELREQDQRLDVTAFTLGLRSVALGKNGLLLNGRPFAIRGMAQNTLSEDHTERLRQRGINTILATLPTAKQALWSTAAQLGFLVLGRLYWPFHFDTMDGELRNQPSSLGFLGSYRRFDLETRKRHNVWMVLKAMLPPFGLRGLQLDEPLCEPLPPYFSFAYGDAQKLASLGTVSIPKLIRAIDQPVAEEVLSKAGILGYIEDPDTEANPLTKGKMP